MLCKCKHEMTLVEPIYDGFDRHVADIFWCEYCGRLLQQNYEGTKEIQWFTPKNIED